MLHYKDEGNPGIRRTCPNVRKALLINRIYLEEYILVFCLIHAVRMDDITGKLPGLKKV